MLTRLTERAPLHVHHVKVEAEVEVETNLDNKVKVETDAWT